MVDTHIKIPGVSPVIRYAANGSQSEFDYSFPVFASEDVVVYLGGALQVSGYDVSGAGNTLGGTVAFDDAPAAGTIITIERRVPFERMTDFLEGGDLSARALNNEFDYLTASVQQLERDQGTMLRYDGLETPGDVVLPGRVVRANRALAFDGDGNLTTVAHGDTLAVPSFTQSGTGALTRSLVDKVVEYASIRDYGAVGDGIVDDTTAIQNALTANAGVFVPEGTYRVTATIALGAGQSLIGVGQGSVLAASADTFNVLELRAGYAQLSSVKITGGDVGVKLYGVSSPCVQNSVCDVVLEAQKTGILLDGYDDTNKPCYWNNFTRVLVLSPSVNGVHLTKTSTGDTPNANHFNTVRVYSSGADISGHGIYVEYGDNANGFEGCECNVKSTATACVRLGANAASTFFTNLYTESSGGVPNVQLDSGSSYTSLINLHAMSDGAAIEDLSGGAYTTFNAGYPNRTTLTKTIISDVTITLLRHDTVYVDAPGVATIDITTARSVHLVASTNGQITMRLPAASAAVGAVYTIKKVDSSANMVIVSAISGTGPDGIDLQLGGPNDYVSVMSNGASWYILSSNRMAGNTRYHDGAGTYDIDMAVDTYLLSAYAGTKTARLPPANASNAIGRTVHVKKTDVSANSVNVTVQGGGLIDGSTSIALNGQYKSLSVVSNGAQWFVINKYL